MSSSETESEYGCLSVFEMDLQSEVTIEDIGQLIAASECLTQRELQEIEKALKESDMDILPPPESSIGLVADVEVESVDTLSSSENIKELLELAKKIGNDPFRDSEQNENPAMECQPDQNSTSATGASTATDETTNHETKVIGSANLPSSSKRFRTVTDAEQKQFEDANQSASTKRNTSWVLGLYQDWHQEVFGRQMDFYSITPEDLATKLRSLFVRLAPKNIQQRAGSMKPQHAEEYHSNTLKNIRADLNRHLQDIGRDIDIVRDKLFIPCNKIINGMLKDKVRSGSARPTAHKEILKKDDLNKISTYLENYVSSPVILRQAVWYNLAIHFVSRGLEFHKQLRLDSFDFCHDKNDQEYVTINHHTQKKTYQGNMSKFEPSSDKRMNSNPESNSCPVKMPRLLKNRPICTNAIQSLYP